MAAVCDIAYKQIKTAYNSIAIGFVFTDTI